jgi:hypothetical protein
VTRPGRHRPGVVARPTVRAASHECDPTWSLARRYKLEVKPQRDSVVSARGPGESRSTGPPAPGGERRARGR